MPTRRTLAVVAIVAPLLAASACSGSSSATKTSSGADDPMSMDITVTNSTSSYVIPWLVGQKQGFFQNHKVTIKKIVNGAGGAATLQTMLSGEQPVGDIGYPAVVQSIAKGVPVVAVSGGSQSNWGLDYYALAANNRVQSIGDIKTWGYSSEGSITQALSFLLPQKAGVSDASVQRVATGGIGNGVALLESGKVDVAVLPPTVVAAYPTKFRRIVQATSLLKTFQQTVITTSTKFANEHPQVVSGVTAGYAESVGWTKQNPDTAAQYYAEFTNTPLPLAKKIVQENIQDDQWNAGFDSAALQHAADGLRATGYTAPVDYCKVFSTAFLPQGASKTLPTSCKP